MQGTTEAAFPALRRLKRLLNERASIGPLQVPHELAEVLGRDGAAAAGEAADDGAGGGARHDALSVATCATSDT